MTNYINRKWTRSSLAPYIGGFGQVAGIQSLEFSDGLERGGRVLDVWTGSGLNFQVLPDRALDIATCRYKGLSLAWRSAVGDAHPAFYDPSGMSWLRSFQGGMLVTCGLDTFGKPHKEGEEDFGLHGRISNTPAKQVNYKTSWVGDEYQLVISGEVRQTRVFGENIVMRRRIQTTLGSNCISIEDIVTNEGFNTQKHMILYHVNTGFPLLSEKSRLKFAVRKTTPNDENSAKGIKEWMVFQPPTPDFVEQNFVHEPETDKNGWAVAELENPELKLGLKLSFDTSTLPYLNEWKMMGEGLYVVGIEPINSLFGEKTELTGQKRLSILEAGESRTYKVALEVVEYP